MIFFGNKHFSFNWADVAEFILSNEGLRSKVVFQFGLYTFYTKQNFILCQSAGAEIQTKPLCGGLW
jgi:hypothetical protein